MKIPIYELIEHTADIGVRIRAKDLKGLFQNAARAMFDIIAEKRPQTKDRRPQTKKIYLKQKADDLEELFVNWLNELLSLSAAKELIFFDFKIDKLDERNIEAQAFGYSIANYKLNTEIKAATYHQLKIKEDKNGWEAELIFDV